MTKLNFVSLGFDDNDREKIDQLIGVKNGIVLVTGPTGSGKSTTLYTALSSLDVRSLKVMSVEDPIEMRLTGVNQVQVNHDLGVDFPNALRSILRQDPDVIMIGEIRDVETAKIAVQAALTGHLVFATLHTNSAIGAIDRLRDMGIESFLIGATLRGVVAQRLVRKFCPDCRPVDGTNSTPNCRACNGNGYKGRMVISEQLAMDETFSKLISKGASETELLDYAKEKGFSNLSQQASRYIRDGKTSTEEIARIIDAGAA